MLARAVLGSLVLLVVLAVVIFLPAGTVRYWQGWLYLGVFGASTLGITLYLMRNDRALLARRLEAGPTAERDPRQRVLSALANVAFVLVYVVAGLDERLGWSGVHASASLVADGFVAAGFLVVLMTFRANSYTSGTVRVAEGQTVVDRGPYAVVRHPMYAGALLLLLATPVALGSWWALLAVMPMFVTIGARLLYEEQYLATNLEGYAEYRQRVRFRLLPFVW